MAAKKLTYAEKQKSDWERGNKKTYTTMPRRTATRRPADTFPSGAEPKTVTPVKFTDQQKQSNVRSMMDSLDNISVKKKNKK